MAYIRGNSINIKNGALASDLQILMDNCTFKNNYGLNVGPGAAISINGANTI